MKHVLVTGASGGLGKAIVNKLLDDGNVVFGLDIKFAQTDNERYHQVICDVTSSESVQSAFNTVSSFTDKLDAIINTAGIMFMGSVVEQSADLMQKIMDVNVVGMCRVNQVFFPLVENARGRIINFSSEYGKYTTVPFHAFYTASKHAVESYTDGLRRELKYLGIKVITIRPGAFDTEMTASTTPYFETICANTTHYNKVYNKLKPLMNNGTKGALNPTVLANVVAKAVYVNRPKRVYKVNHDFLVKFLSVLPDGLIDWIFLHVLG